jgi:transposase
MVAANLNINYENARKIIQKYNKTGQIIKSKIGGVKPLKLLPNEILFLKERIDLDCTLTLKELQILIQQTYYKEVALSTISKYIKGFNYSFKRLHVVTERSLSQDIMNKRKEYAFNFIQKTRLTQNIFFIDETGFQIEMRPFYGYSPINTPAVTSSPMIKSKNITVMACLSTTSLFYYKFLDESGNRYNFYEFMNELCDFCNNLGLLNSIFVLDNARFHHCVEIKELVAHKNHELMFLPAYTPIFNPIENMFSQWKNLVRRRS